jgi:hypothetical protein
VHCYEFGLGSKNRNKILITAPKGESTTAYILTNDTHSEYQKETIQIKKLDKVYKSIGVSNVKFVKIDTEGCDLDVILGASELIKKYKPALLVEMHWHMYYNQEKKDAVFQLLNNLGYRYHIYKMEHYEKSPNQIFDHKHNGAQMSNLHFHMVMHHPSYGAKMESYSEEPMNPPQIN